VSDNVVALDVSLGFHFFILCMLSESSLWLPNWNKLYVNDTGHLTGYTKSRERNSWKGEFSDNCRKLAGAVHTWRGVAVRSRHEQQRPEKLGRRQSTTGCDSNDDDAERKRPRKTKTNILSHTWRLWDAK